MKILHIETSSKNCSVAISKDDNMLCLCEEISEDYKHSENLHTFVKWALEGAELTLKDVNAVCLGKGPGSYTGLRIGAAAAKGFCYGLNIPLVSVNSLDTIAEDFFEKSNLDYIVPMIDARRMEVYTKVFNIAGVKISSTEAKILSENSFFDYKDKSILFIGDGAKKAKNILKLQNAEFKSEIYPSAKNLIRIGIEKVKNKQFENIAYFEPFYLKEFNSCKT